MKIRLLAAAVLAALSFGAHAVTNTTVVYADNFNGDQLGRNVVPAGWTVTEGTVGVEGDGQENSVDLNGGTGQPGLLSTTFSVAAGSYVATFDLGSFMAAGNAAARRGALPFDVATDDVTVAFGGVSSIITLGPNDDLTTYSVSAVSAGGDLSLSFQDEAGTVTGILDNVVVTTTGGTAPVPEPANIALMMAGLAAFGVLARRRRG